MKKIVALVLSLVMVLGLATTAFAATTSYENLYAQSTADGTKQGTVTAVAYDGAAVKYNVKTGAFEKAGTMAYVDVSGKAYVIVNDLGAADLVVYTDSEYTKVKFYLDEITNSEYFDGVVFNNFGKSCGQIDLGDDFDKDATYYTIKGTDAGLYVSSETGAYNLKVGASYVKVDFVAGTPNAHKPVMEYKNNKLVKVYCSVCNCAAVEAPNFMSIPEKADTTGLSGNWYWTAGTVAADDATVESAKTFDAGIAMYVGMSVMAAAGSAVVLKKKD